MNTAAMIAIFKAAFIATALAVTYCLPMIVAQSRRHPRRAIISLVNICLGWTFLGWIAALLWARSKPALR